jgi:hypothetical protein
MRPQSLLLTDQILPKRQRKFAELVALGKSPQEAYAESYPGASEHSLRSTPYTLLRKQTVRLHICEIRRQLTEAAESDPQVVSKLEALRFASRVVRCDGRTGKTVDMDGKEVDGADLIQSVDASGGCKFVSKTWAVQFLSDSLGWAADPAQPVTKMGYQQQSDSLERLRASPAARRAAVRFLKQLTEGEPIEEEVIGAK